MVLHLRVPRTQNLHYPVIHCLRDLICKICIVDPCHKFTCYLDDCIHELFVNSKRVQELCSFLDGVKESGTCKELVGQETLPKDSPSSGCWCLARRRGTYPWSGSQELEKEVELITRFLSMLGSFLVDAYTFNVDQSLLAERKAPPSHGRKHASRVFTKFLQ